MKREDSILTGNALRSKSKTRSELTCDHWRLGLDPSTEWTSSWSRPSL